MSEQKNEVTPTENDVQPLARGHANLTFLSDGSISIDIDGAGMMDLWAASNLLKMKGDEIYIAGMTEMRNQLIAQQKEADAKDPTKRIIKAVNIPETKASN